MNTPLTRSDGTLRPMLVLALPVLAEQTLNMLVGYTDWWLTGHYLEGPAYQAAMALMAYVLWLFPCLFSAVAIGATALVARFVGAGDGTLANRVTNQAVLAGVLAAIAATAVSWWLARPFIAAMQLQDDAARLALRYIRIMVPVLPCIMFEQVGIACLRGAGDTMSGLVAKVIVNTLNVAISFVLVVGWGPFPRLGWEGLALGTAVAHGVGGLIILGLLVRGRFGLRLRLRWMRLDPDLLRRLMRIGIPGGVDTLALLGCHLVFVSIINRLGTVAAAAHGLGVTIESMAYLPGSAFQVAAATLAGQYLGSRDRRRAARSAWLSCLVGGGVMLAAGFAFYFGAEPLTAFFTGDSQSETARTTVPLLRLVSITMPPLALTMILTGALRGAGDTRWPLAITFVGFLGIRIPLACLLAWQSVPIPGTGMAIVGLGWGVWGAWLAMVFDVFVRAVLVVARFLHGGWTRIKV